MTTLEEKIIKLKQTLFSVVVQDGSRIHRKIMKLFGDDTDKIGYTALINAVVEVCHHYEKKQAFLITNKYKEYGMNSGQAFTLYQSPELSWFIVDGAVFYPTEDDYRIV